MTSRKRYAIKVLIVRVYAYSGLWQQNIIGYLSHCVIDSFPWIGNFKEYMINYSFLQLQREGKD